jgi:hypothetical protein
VVVTLPSASVFVVTLLPSSYVVVQDCTLLAVVHAGPLVTAGAVGVVEDVLEVVLPGVGPLSFTPFLSNCSQVVTLAAVVVHTS